MPIPFLSRKKKTPPTQAPTQATAQAAAKAPTKAAAPKPSRAEQRQAMRQEEYAERGPRVSDASILDDIPNSELAAIHDGLAKAQDRQTFEQALALLLRQDNREDFFNRYMELAIEEREIFIKALSNRDMLDKTKGRRVFKHGKIHVDQKAYEETIDEGAKLLSVDEAQLQNSAGYQKNWGNLSLGGGGLGNTPEIYQRAASNVFTSQISDQADKAKDSAISERDSLSDLKLLNRAFKLVGEARKKAGAAGKGGKANTASRLDKKATMGMRQQAASVQDMEGFRDFMRHMQEVNEEGNQEFFKLDETEQRLFIMGLANPQVLETNNYLIRGFSKEQREKRDTFKRAFRDVGDVYNAEKGLYAPSRAGEEAKATLPGVDLKERERVVLQPGDYAKAATSLLAKEGGLLDKHKIGYNQRLLLLGIQFAQASRITRTRKLETEHAKFAEERNAASGHHDVSTASKMTASATMLHYERNLYRDVADRVKDLASFEAFLEKAAPGHELLSKFKALEDAQKTLAVIGLSRRSVLNRKTDRVRLSAVQWLGDKINGDAYDNPEGRRALLDEAHKQRFPVGGGPGAGLTVDEPTAKAAALNLIGKETQSVGSIKQNIDLHLLERALTLVQEEDDMRRKEEEERRMSAGTEGSLMRGLYGVRRADERQKKLGERAAVSETAANAAPIMQPRSPYTPALNTLNQTIEDVTYRQEATGYDSSRIAKRLTLVSADEVANKAMFDAFLESQLTADEAFGLYAKYDALSERDQIYLIKALAHRGVLDRDKDKGLGKGVGHGILTGVTFGLANLKTSHGYEDRAGRDALKKSYAEGAQEEAATLAQEEYQLAAHALLSEKTRNAVGASTKLSLNEHRKELDVNLLERGFKLLEVMRDKREIALRAKHKAEMDQVYQGREERPEITNRANTSQLDALSNVQDAATFFAFLKSLGSLEYAKRFSELDAEEKKRLVYGLSHREMLDKSSPVARNTFRDQAQRDSSILAYSRAGISEPTAADYKRAAYELVSSRTRALGTHRVAARKSGALDEGLMDRAFEFVKQSVRAREKHLDIDREQALRGTGIQLSEKVGSADKEMALAVKDLQSFDAFLEHALKKADKEKYLFLFRAYRPGEQRLFVLALRHLGECPAVLESIQKNKAPRGVGPLQMASLRYPIEKDVALSPEEYRHAAAAMVQTKLDRDHFDSEPFQKANSVVQAVLQNMLATSGQSAAAGMNAYEKETGGTGYQESEFSRTGRFESAGKHIQSGAVRTGRSLKATAGKVGAWSVDQRDAVRRGDIGVKAGIQRKLMAPIISATGTFDRSLERAERTRGAEGFGRMLEVGMRERPDGTAAEPAEAFLEAFERYARAEKNLSAFIALKGMTPEEKALFFKALGDRNMLDLTQEATSAGEGQAPERQYENAEGRNALLDAAMEGGLSYTLEDVKKAGEALFSAHAFHKGTYSQAFDREKHRNTMVDWKLVGKALELVALAREEKKHRAQAGKDAATGENRQAANDRIRSVFRSTHQEEKGIGAQAGRVMKQNEDTMNGAMLGVNVGMGGYTAYSMARSSAAELGKASLLKATNIEANLKDIFSLESTGFLNQVTEFAGNANNLIVEMGLPLLDLRHVVQTITSAVDLVDGVLTYTGNDAAMQEFLLANLPENAVGADKENIAVKTLENAFGVIKEQSTRGIAEGVFGVIEHLTGAGALAAKLAGVPNAIVSAVTKGVGLILSIGRAVTKKIIDMVQGDVVDRYLDIPAATRRYNQQVKAQNLFRTDQKRRVQELSQAEVKDLIMKKLGFTHVDDCKRYACTSIAAGVAYSYGSPDVPAHQRMGARSTARTLGASDAAGQLDTQKLVRKLMGG